MFFSWVCIVICLVIFASCIWWIAWAMGRESRGELSAFGRLCHVALASTAIATGIACGFVAIHWLYGTESGLATQKDLLSDVPDFLVNLP